MQLDKGCYSRKVVIVVVRTMGRTINLSTVQAIIVQFHQTLYKVP